MTSSGERDLVLARLRAGAAAPPPANHAHPAPAATHEAPPVRFRVLESDAEVDLVHLLATAATEAGCTVHPAGGAGASAGAGAAEEVEVVAAAVADVVSRFEVRTAVATDEPEVGPIVEALVAAGVEVGPAADVAAAAAADLGVTACRAAIAATGTVVVDSTTAGARWASLLPRVHLCAVPPARVVATPADVLRSFGPAAPPPAGVWFVTGPSRTGDIEQLLTRGVHGPVAVELLLR